MSAADLLVSLGRRLDYYRPLHERLDAYYGGRQPLAMLSPELAAALGTRVRPLVLGWPRVVVSALEERLDVEGFRLGSDQPTDDSLWSIWQDNGLDELSQQAHTEALVLGRAYVLVWSGPDGSPRITVESARQCYVVTDPGSRQRVAAVKRFTDLQGYGVAFVYEPDRVTRFRTLQPVPLDAWAPGYPAPSATFDLAAGGWAVVDVMPNPLGVVPLIPLVSGARLLTPDGESELAPILPIADAINSLATDMLVTSAFYAEPRRWVTGVDLPTDAAGEVVDDESMSRVAGRTWMLEDPAAKVGQFSEASLASFTDAIGMLTRTLAAMGSLPPHYTDAGSSTANPTSADAIRSAEASLTQKARRRQRAFGGAWEEAMRIAVLVRDGVDRPDLARLETVWRNPETPTIAAAADAAAKLAAIGVPLGALLPGLGFTPGEQERIRTLRQSDALDAAGVNLQAILP